MNTDILWMILSLFLNFSGSREYGSAEFVYAVASIPPTSNATYVRVSVAGQLSADCERGAVGYSIACSTALVAVNQPVSELEFRRELPIVVESDGEWEARVYLRPYATIPARPSIERIPTGSHELFLPGVYR